MYLSQRSSEIVQHQKRGTELLTPLAPPPWDRLGCYIVPSTVMTGAAGRWAWSRGSRAVRGFGRRRAVSLCPWTPSSRRSEVVKHCTKVDLNHTRWQG